MFRAFSASSKAMLAATVTATAAITKTQCEVVLDKKEFKAFKLEKVEKLVSIFPLYMTIYYLAFTTCVSL